LQTTTPELRQILVFIWTKILALDKVHFQGLFNFFDKLVHVWCAILNNILNFFGL
jgi:hypothetical protein